MKEDTPSLTAYAVLKGLDAVAKSRHHPAWRHLIPEEAKPFIEAFLKEGAGYSMGHRAISVLPPAAAFRLAEHQINQGMPLHYAARKLAIEHTVRDAIADGATQVVMISGGFDTLALRLHKEFPEVTFFETDHPATQAPKLKALNHIRGYSQGENLHFLGADLGKTKLEEVLAEDSAYDRTKKTVSIAEGLTMYLEAPQVDQLLESVSHIGCEGSRAIVSIMGSNASKGQGYEKNMAGRLQNSAAEQQKFTLAHTEIPQFVADRGFQLDALSSYQDLQTKVEGRTLRPDLKWMDENYLVMTKTDATPIVAEVGDVPLIAFDVPKPSQDKAASHAGKGR